MSEPRVSNHAAEGDSCLRAPLLPVIHYGQSNQTNVEACRHPFKARTTEFTTTKPSHHVSGASGCGNISGYAQPTKPPPDLCAQTPQFRRPDRRGTDPAPIADPPERPASTNWAAKGHDSSGAPNSWAWLRTDGPGGTGRRSVGPKRDWTRPAVAHNRTTLNWTTTVFVPG